MTHAGGQIKCDADGQDVLDPAVTASKTMTAIELGLQLQWTKNY